MGLLSLKWDEDCDMSGGVGGGFQPGHIDVNTAGIGLCVAVVESETDVTIIMLIASDVQGNVGS